MPVESQDINARQELSLPQLDTDNATASSMMETGATSSTDITADQAMMLWKLHRQDTRTSFRDLESKAEFGDLEWLLTTLESTFSKDSMKRGRERVLGAALFTLWANDAARKSGSLRGAMKHTWPLQSIHPTKVGKAADQAMDLPVFFKDHAWSQEQLDEYAVNTPLQRLQRCSAFVPWLWEDLESPTLRIRLLRPAKERQGGQLSHFEFRIRGASLSKTTAANKTLVLLWVKGALICTSLSEMLACEFIEAPSKDTWTVTKWLDGLAGSTLNQKGPILIRKSYDTHGSLLIEWVLLTCSERCQRWTADREISHDDEVTLDSALFQRFTQELAKGSEGLAVAWGDHFDALFI